MNTLHLTPKFEEALIYATRLHTNQTRKISGVPYIAQYGSVKAEIVVN
ncbi:hypothetical protein [Nostoc sp. DSM 114167]|jgi:(p)ppGpp synthase/HD superfamily hydrolase